MRRLLLLRHAKTESDASSGRDQDRRLDDRGRRDAAEIGGWIGRHPPAPDAVLVSNAVRAQQTWEIAWEAMKRLVPKPQVETLPELYGADPVQLLQAIHAACGGENAGFIRILAARQCGVDGNNDAFQFRYALHAVFVDQRPIPHGTIGIF